MRSPLIYNLQEPETVKEYLKICGRPEIDALFAEADRRKEARQGLGNRLTETPATTLDPDRLERIEERLKLDPVMLRCPAERLVSPKTATFSS